MDNHRVHTEWQLSFSVVHYIMMENSALAGEGGVVHANPLSLYLPSCTKLLVYSPVERANTLPISSLPLYVLCVDNRH